MQAKNGHIAKLGFSGGFEMGSSNCVTYLSARVTWISSMKTGMQGPEAVATSAKRELVPGGAEIQPNQVLTSG